MVSVTYEVEERERIKPECKIPYCRFLNCEISTGVCLEMKKKMYKLNKGNGR
jgi:hypothetical protein